MDLDQLRGFLSVAELGSFTAAAERHFVTQPAISLRIRALEEEVGARLLERRGRRVRLTPAGEAFRQRAAEAVRAVERGAAEVGELKGLRRGRLAVGAIDAAGIDLLPAPLREFHHRWPGVELVVRVEPSGSLIRALLSGELDCAVITLPVERGDLVVDPVAEEEMVLVVPPDATERSAATALRHRPLIGYPQGSVTRGLIDAALAARGLAPRIAMELSHPEAIRGLVEAGLGAAVLPERVVKRGGAVTIVPGLRLTRRLGLARRAGEEMPPAVRAFLELLAPPRPKGAARSA